MICSEPFCIAEDHSHENDPNLHVDNTGTTWRTDDDGSYEIVHTYHDPWTD